MQQLTIYFICLEFLTNKVKIKCNTLLLYFLFATNVGDMYRTFCTWKQRLNLASLRIFSCIFLWFQRQTTGHQRVQDSWRESIVSRKILYNIHSYALENPFCSVYDFILFFYFPRTNPLKRYRNEHLTITLPEGLTLHDIKWFYVWCEDFAVSVHIIIHI